MAGRLCDLVPSLEILFSRVRGDLCARLEAEHPVLHVYRAVDVYKDEVVRPGSVRVPVLLRLFPMKISSLMITLSIVGPPHCTLL